MNLQLRSSARAGVLTHNGATYTVRVRTRPFSESQSPPRASPTGAYRALAGSSVYTPAQKVQGPLVPYRHQQQQLYLLPCKPGRQQVVCRAEGETGESAGASNDWVYSGALLAMWAALMGYIFFLAPNQTPSIDSFVVQKLIGQKPDDPFQVNPVFEAVWNCMGLYPLIYAALLIPGARSKRLPAWPFVSASVFLGAYALIPYMCLWAPKDPPQQLPPPEEELSGWNKLFMKGAETPYLPALLLAGASFWVYRAIAAGGGAWLMYLQLFDESRLVHATSVDFLLCTALLPFWMSVDAQGRDWEKRDALVPVLSVLPLVGPALYLLLRPKAYGGSISSSNNS